MAGEVATSAGTGALAGSSLGPWGSLAGGALGAAGSLLGGSKASSAAKKAAKVQAKAMLKAQQRAQDYQEKMSDRAAGYLNPYFNQFANRETLNEFSGFGKEGGYGGDIMAQMEALGQGGLNMDYQSDPAYQWRQQQQEEAMNRQLAGRGMWDSRAGMNMLSDANMDLSGQEADKQYNRALNERNWQYGDLSNRYNLGYQDVTNRFNVGQNAASGLGGIWSGLGSNVGNQMLNSGMASAQNSANLNAQAGQIWGNTIAGLGQNLQQGIEDYQMQPYINAIMKNMVSGNSGAATPSFNLNSGYGGGGPSLDYGGNDWWNQ